MALPRKTYTTDRSQSVKRRTLIAAAWTAPTVVATTAAPAFAASPDMCPTVQVERGSWLSLAFGKVSDKGKWKKDSTVAARFSLGDAKDKKWGALAFMSDQDDVVVTVREYVMSLTWEIDMTVKAPSGWTVSKARSGSQYTYTFTYTGKPITKAATTPLGNEPDGKSSKTFIQPVEFDVKVGSDQFKKDETVSDGRRDYPFTTSYRVVYDVDVPGIRCDLIDQEYTRTSDLTLTPS